MQSLQKVKRKGGERESENVGKLRVFFFFF